jgi:hypothetical protein
MHPAALPPEELAKQISEARTRRSGPGGQHRNKVETAVILRHLPTGIAAEASERRSQSENRTMALKRLRLALALEHRTPSAAGRPSARWRSRTRGTQLVIAAAHDDYPALLAEALDHLHHAQGNMPAVAETLDVSTTQLAKLFKKAPAAWMALNRLRVACGLPPLK